MIGTFRERKEFPFIDVEITFWMSLYLKNHIFYIKRHPEGYFDIDKWKFLDLAQCSYQGYGYAANYPLISRITKLEQLSSWPLRYEGFCQWSPFFQNRKITFFHSPGFSEVFLRQARIPARLDNASRLRNAYYNAWSHLEAYLFPNTPRWYYVHFWVAEYVHISIINNEPDTGRVFHISVNEMLHNGILDKS